MKRLALFLIAVSAATAAVPTPKSHFGHEIGADRVLVDWSKVVSYFAALEKSSDPRGLAEAEAEKLIAQGKTVVMITCSIHATEVASTQTAVEFAYRLITEDKPKFNAILANTIFILVPSLNPDGVDIVTQWYRKTLGTPYEGTAPPELYHRYVGHDNNRDWYIMSQPETRAVVSQFHNVWHPQIVYDVHQQGATASRMFVPPWLNPIEPNIDPIIAQLCNAIGAGMAADLTAAGKTGVAINAMYDFWTPARHYQAYHGGLRLLSESASARLATPITITPDQISSQALGYNPRERSWNYLEPWPGGEWHIRDIIDYQLIAIESCLYQAALRREDMLRAFYKIGKRASEKTSPAAFLISKSQLDPGSARKMLDTLAFGQVEVDQTQTGMEVDGKKYPAGSYVIQMKQPYSAYAKTLLERQNYPDLRLYPGGPPKRPYDVTAHTLPLLMGVDVAAAEQAVTAQLTRVKSYDFDPAKPAAADVLPAADTASYRAVNRIWKSGGAAYRDPATGDFSAKPLRGMARLRQPRIGLYKSFIPSMDEGWTRWMLEEFGFAYKSASNADLQAGGLRSSYDVILFADQRAATIASGYAKGAMPDEYTGGVGAKGAEALKKFMADGGVVVFLNDSSEFAERSLGVDMKNTMRGFSSKDFYCPGSLLRVSLDTSSKLAYGLPPEIAIWNEASPAWTAPAVGAVARYPKENLLASGWLLGEKLLAGKAALLDIPSGKGRLVAFGFRPQYRAQSYQSFKLLFNALLLNAGN